MDTDMERSWIHRLPWRRKNRADTKAAQIKFLPELEIARDEGWANLSLSLVNKSSFMIWVEDANVALAHVDAALQSSAPSRSITQQILQYVQPKASLNVSLANAVYDAAGRPQGPYTGLLQANVRYCVFDEWSEAATAPCRIAMAAINAIDLHPARWYEKKVRITKI
jgi:hypothetical protein